MGRRKSGEVLEFHIAEGVELRWDDLKGAAVVEAQALARVSGAKFFQVLSARGRILAEGKAKALILESSKQLMRGASGSRVVELVDVA